MEFSAFHVDILRTSSSLRNLSYIVFDKDSKEAFVIDPFDPEKILEYCFQKKIKIKWILNTHSHPDHTKGNLALKLETKAKVLGHTLGKATIPGLDGVLDDDTVLRSTGGESLVSWETPGHTSDHLSFSLVSGETVLGIFSGDTVFNAGVGNCKRGGDPKQLYSTIQKRYLTLSKDCYLFPGHDYWENNLKFALLHGLESELGKELTQKALQEEHKDSYLVSQMELEYKINPFFRMDSLESFVQLRGLRDLW